MFLKKPIAVLIGGVLCGAFVAPAQASVDNESLMREFQRLAERVAQLESDNRSLQAALNKGVASPDPVLVDRVEEVEKEVVALRGKPNGLGRLEGVSAGASLLMVAQRVEGGAADNRQFNARADVEVELPGGSIGDAGGQLFAHLRAGDGDGLDNGSFATPNATAFNFAQPVLMQAWYQLNVPVGGSSGNLGQIEATVGKIDPFGFFDGNAIADDESESFMNLAFVHNPLLDAGGDIGVGTHGASPGLRLAYVWPMSATSTAATISPHRWGCSGRDRVPITPIPSTTP
jgi:hypothetical protein